MSEAETTNTQGISSEAWDAQQALIDQWVIELAERLKVNREACEKALVDWMYINTQTDWLQLAADEDSIEHQRYPAPMEGYGEELDGFLADATSAWCEAWGVDAQKPKAKNAGDLLRVIGGMINDFEERNS